MPKLPVTHKFSFRIPASQMVKLRKIARDQRASIAWVVRDVISTLIKVEGRPPGKGLKKGKTRR